VLVTDFVVAGATHELPPLGALALSSSIKNGLKQREFFTATDPFEIREFYKHLSRPGPTAEDVTIEGPWRWEVGGRVLGVCGVMFRRRK
jgi:hypothetical protein